ncbi:HAD family hydrolase [Streptomyces sp. NPDC001889]
MAYVAIFDLDGTLVDTPQAIVRTFTAAFAALGAPPREAQQIRATIGMPLEGAFGRLMGIAPEDDRVTAAVAEYQLAFREIILPRAGELVFPGVREGLAELRRQGIPTAVATSKFHASADALLRAADLREEFAVVLGADQVTRPKPDPEMGHEVLRLLGATPGEAVMVGDTTHDLLMARAAGMRSIAVTYGIHSRAELLSAGPTWVADTFDGVLACLAEGRGADLRESETPV